MVHEGVPQHKIWEEWEEAHDGRVRVFVHQDASKDPQAHPGAGYVQRRRLRTSLVVGWGKPSQVLDQTSAELSKL